MIGCIRAHWLRDEETDLSDPNNYLVADVISRENLKNGGAAMLKKGY